MLTSSLIFKDHVNLGRINLCKSLLGEVDNLCVAALFH